jgi:hypothetical protein
MFASGGRLRQGGWQPGVIGMESHQFSVEIAIGTPLYPAEGEQPQSVEVVHPVATLYPAHANTSEVSPSLALPVQPIERPAGPLGCRIFLFLPLFT